MTFSGMTPDQIDAAANQLRTQAQELQSISSRVTNLVNQAVKNWQGNDMASFRSAWYGSYQGKMSAAKNRLESMASQLNRQASDQRNTSNASTVTTTVMGPIAAYVPGGSLLTWDWPDAGTVKYLGGVAQTYSDTLTPFWDAANVGLKIMDDSFVDGWHMSPHLISDWKDWNGLPSNDPMKMAADAQIGKYGAVVSGISLISDVNTLATGWQDMNNPYDKVIAVSDTVADATATMAGVGTALAGAGKILTTSPLAKAIPGLNIVSNIASAVSDGAQAINDFKSGNWGHGILNGVEALASVASCIPGPIGVVGTGLSLVLHAGEGLFSLFTKK